MPKRSLMLSLTNLGKHLPQDESKFRREMPKYRTFNGKRYFLATKILPKSSAKDFAARMRKVGAKCRVTKSQYGWVVWMR